MFGHFKISKHPTYSMVLAPITIISTTVIPISLPFKGYLFAPILHFYTFPLVFIFNKTFLHTNSYICALFLCYPNFIVGNCLHKSLIFALSLLIQFPWKDISYTDTHVILDYVSKIGCGVSMLALLITLVIFIGFR